MDHLRCEDNDRDDADNGLSYEHGYEEQLTRTNDGYEYATPPLRSLDSAALARMLLLRSPEDVVRRVVQASRAKQANRLLAIRKSNSERARRYRKRKKERVGNTMEEVEALRVLVAELCARKRLYEERQLAAPFTASQLAVKMVQEYFAVFRYGMQMPPGSPAAGKPTSASLRYSGDRAICSRRQEAFLENMTHPDVVFGNFVGVHPLIDQWKKYSHFHTSVRLEFGSFRMTTFDSCPIISTTGVLHLRYSRMTMEKLFPHTLYNEELVQKMIGKEVHLRYSDHFYFNEQGKMIRYELVPDFVGALHEVVGSLRDVAQLLGDALIEQDAVIKQDMLDDMELVASSSTPPPIMNIEFILS